MNTSQFFFLSYYHWALRGNKCSKSHQFKKVKPTGAINTQLLWVCTRVYEAFTISVNQSQFFSHCSVPAAMLHYSLMRCDFSTDDYVDSADWKSTRVSPKWEQLNNFTTEMIELIPENLWCQPTRSVLGICWKNSPFTLPVIKFFFVFFLMQRSLLD